MSDAYEWADVAARCTGVPSCTEQLGIRVDSQDLRVAMRVVHAVNAEQRPAALAAGRDDGQLQRMREHRVPNSALAAGDELFLWLKNFCSRANASTSNNGQLF